VRPGRLVLALGLALAAGCGPAPTRHAGHGLVVDVARDERQVVIEHDDIPGLMPAMTMNFEMPDAALLATLAPGQVIDFEVEFDGKSYRVVAATVRAQRPPPRDGPAMGGVIDLGQAVPEFALTDQDGKPRSFSELRGRFVLVDFVYTNCPGPCPIQTGIHVEAQRRLPPALREATRFVSISLDPERDTPDRMRAYAQKRGADLASWSFLTGTPEAVDGVLRTFGVGRAPGKDGEIDHLVVSFLVDPEGRVARRYVGLRHGPDEILADLERMASG
jgi:protein SCO1/2